MHILQLIAQRVISSLNAFVLCCISLHARVSVLLLRPPACLPECMFRVCCLRLYQPQWLFSIRIYAPIKISQQRRLQSAKTACFRVRTARITSCSASANVEATQKRLINHKRYET
jgi:hypothetical protein